MSTAILRVGVDVDRVLRGLRGLGPIDMAFAASVPGDGTFVLDRFNGARTNDERAQTFRELERYVLLEQVYGVPMYDETQTTPYRSYVKGMPVPPEDITANLSFATVWLDK